MQEHISRFTVAGATEYIFVSDSNCENGVLLDSFTHVSVCLIEEYGSTLKVS